MFKIRELLNSFDYRTIRALHICIVFTTAFLIDLLFHIPRGSWMAFTVMMIYAGFDVGTSLQRVIHRFCGVVLGLCMARAIWFFCHLDYRLIFLVIPVLIAVYYYLLGKPYVFPTVFTVVLSVVGSDYFASRSFFVAWFFRDYFMCTIFAVIICWVFEYFIFRHVNMTRRFYSDLQKNLINVLETFFETVKHAPIRKSLYVKATISVNKKMIDLRDFVQNTKNDYHNKDNLIVELDEFNIDVHLIYQNIRKMFVLPMEERVVLMKETELLMLRLKQLFMLEKAA